MGRGATAMLEADPDRHSWGLGRHFIGSNFFWYLRDPAGNFSEYYSDMVALLMMRYGSPGCGIPRGRCTHGGHRPRRRFSRLRIWPR